MNPWMILGWIAVAAICGPILLKVLVAVTSFVADCIKEARLARRLRRAHKGKVRCEYRDCVEVATRRGPRLSFCCERHIGTYLTRSGAVSFAFKLDHAKDAS